MNGSCQDSTAQLLKPVKPTTNSWKLTTGFDYRVDTIDPKTPELEDKTLHKLIANSLYGKRPGQVILPAYETNSLVYKTTDSLRTRKPFTKEDLFYADVQDVHNDGQGSGWYVCMECGACVRHAKTHVTWHNKIADL